MATEENREPPSEQPPASRNDGLSCQVADHLSGVAFKLALSEDEHKVCFFSARSVWVVVQISGLKSVHIHACKQMVL